MRVVSFPRALLLLALASLVSCGGGGGGGGGSGVGTPDGPGGPSKIFVADSGNNVVVSFFNPDPSPGTMRIDRTISGPAVSPSMPDLAYDAGRDRLYIVNGSSIMVLNNASTQTGNQAPDRTISSVSLGAGILAIELDTVHDILYVADVLDNVYAFNSASTINGSVSPNRSITVTRSGIGVPIMDFYVDGVRDVLYVSAHIGGGGGGVVRALLIYDNASTISGTLAANRELTFSVSTWLIAGDSANDRIFVSDTDNSSVRVFDNASTANGPGTPNRTINLPTFAQRLALSPVGNRLYAIAASTTGVYIINNASTGNGVVPVKLVTTANAGSLTGIAVAP